MNWLTEPVGIEQESMKIIGRELAGRELAPDIFPVVRRVIHATADFDFADILHFSPGAVGEMISFLQKGGHIFCDTNMIRAGIQQGRLAGFGGQVHCFMAEGDVAAEARRRGVTRAWVSVERAAAMSYPMLFVVGNAPTALIRLRQLWDVGQVNIAGVIGVPVGFVNVVESKELFLDLPLPAILSLGRKGGSTVAAAAVNALLIRAGENS